MFVLDLSGSVDTVYHVITNFTRRMLLGLPMQQQRTQVGIITYSTEARVHAYLNQYQVSTCLPQPVSGQYMHTSTSIMRVYMPTTTSIRSVYMPTSTSSRQYMHTSTSIMLVYMPTTTSIRLVYMPTSTSSKSVHAYLNQYQGRVHAYLNQYQVSVHAYLNQYQVSTCLPQPVSGQYMPTSTSIRLVHAYLNQYQISVHLPKPVSEQCKLT